jgi:predicted nucleic acid-binding protein
MISKESFRSTATNKRRSARSDSGGFGKETDMGYTFDSCYLIDLANGDSRAVTKAQQIESTDEEKFITTPVLYEIMVGLLYGRSRTETNRFRRAVSKLQILPFDETSARLAAEIQSELMKMGRRSSDIDVLIAGIAAHHGHVLITRDQQLGDLEISIPLDIEAY